MYKTTWKSTALCRVHNICLRYIKTHFYKKFILAPFFENPNSGRNCLLRETLSLDGSFSSSVFCGLPTLFVKCHTLCKYRYFRASFVMTKEKNAGTSPFVYWYAVLQIRDVYPGSRIPDPRTATKERGKKICYHTFFCSHKFHKIENYFIFEMLKKKIWPSFQRIIKLFTQKFVTKLSKRGQKGTCSTTGKPTHLFRTKCVSLDSV